MKQADNKQPSDSSGFTNTTKVDMATTLKMLDYFYGNKDEDSGKWIRKVSNKCELLEMSSEDTKKIIILLFKGNAEEWYTDNREILGKLPVNQLVAALTERFTTQVTTENVLEKFLSTEQVKTIQAYETLLEEASILNERGCIAGNSLIKLVTKRTPPNIQAILYLISMQSNNWQEFKAKALNITWLEFEENASINAIQRNQRYNNEKRVYINKIQKFCKLHGNKANHSTDECWTLKKVKEIEQREKRKKINSIQEEINKEDSLYNVKNPFFVKIKIKDGNIHEGLIDTGADVSIIHRRNLPENCKTKKNKTFIKTASGTKMQLKEQAINVKATIGKREITFSPLITTTEPKYTIIGCETIKNNIGLITDINVNKYDPEITMKTKKISTINISYEEEIKNKYKNLFKSAIDQLTLCTMGEHTIETIDQIKPIYISPRRTPVNYEKALEDQIKKLKQSKIIKESKSTWSSPIVTVPKPDGNIRMCIDYRQLNKITIKDYYPIPRIDQILDALREATVFSTLDATSGYYQIAMNQKDKEKTAFNYKGSTFEFNRMPFGLCNAPSTFQRAMDQLFKEELWKFVIPYLDDVIVFSKGEIEHKRHLELVFEKLKAAGMALNEKKCKLFREEIKILGSIVSYNTIKPDPSKIEAIKNYEKPSTVKQLRSFLGLANYIRDYVPKFADLLEPLTGMLKGFSERSQKSLNWTPELIEAFKKAKIAITNITFRTQPDFNKEFILITDASSVAIGAILAQKDENGQERLIAAYSKKLDECQKRYSITDRELLAVVKSIEHFRTYLAGKEFELRTDHQALEYMNTAQDPTSRLLRWSLKLQEYKFRITYIKGETNIADGLSRPINEKIEKVNSIISEPSPEQKKKILTEYHQSTGHGTPNTMKFLLKQKYYWDGLYRDIDSYCRQCCICSKFGESKINTKNIVIKTSKPNELWEVDLIGRIENENKNNKFIFIAIDHYTKWIETTILSTKDALSTEQAIRTLIIEKHGIPVRILSDNGLEFNNKNIKTLCKEKNFKWEFSSPNHHQTIGAVERVNQTLMNKLKKLTDFGKLSWERALAAATFAVNISFNRAIGMSPFMLKYGLRPNLPIDTIMGTKSEQISKSDLQKVRETTFDNYLDNAIEKGKKSVKLNLKIGDKVLIYKKPLKNKLAQNWWPGYKIKEIIEPAAYIVTNNKKDYRLNKSHVKIDKSKFLQGGCRSNSYPLKICANFYRSKDETSGQ